MAIEWDPSKTLAAEQHESNPSLIRNWVFPIAFAMTQVGVPELTKDTLPVFMARQNVWYAAMGERSPFHTDPTIVEMFIGMRAWGRHSQGELTDAAFGRHIVGMMKNTYSDLNRQYKDRVPGDVLHNMRLESLVKGECQTCASHHTQDVVHDGERTDDDE